MRQPSELSLATLLETPTKKGTRWKCAIFVLFQYGILLPKLFLPTVRENRFSGRVKLLKFEAEGGEFEKKN